MTILPILAILLIFLILIVAVILVYRSYRKSKNIAVSVQQRTEELRERQARALPARATVVSLRDKPAVYNGLQEVRIRLRLSIEMPNKDAYSAATVWYVDVAALNNLQAGTALSVKVDRRDEQLIFPNVSWARMHPDN
ncbi:MAG: hypothetical protein DWQ07_03355 [Chloroflexi bacterium]|nr:MAG: hypothetical protein DWQ07_03355 [Chloroflexota bacterium]MBL1193462.1 hypothetical protein [Chloroflexota bacterium]NOH10753.1 hypothetical protein [Chloroflexota bacterium]